MRKLFIALLLAASTAIAAQTSIPHYVAAKTGLSIREKPELGAKVLDKIPYGTKISLLPVDMENEPVVTEGMNGYWQKVKYNNKTGYIIDSYLFPWPPPKLATVKEMRQYFAQVTVPFGAKLIVKSGNMLNLDDAGWQINKQLYKNGAEWHETTGYEYGGNMYFLPGFSMHQGFLLLRLIPEFKDIFGENDEFPVESKTISKGDVEYTIKVSKMDWVNDGYHWVERIRIEYSPDASYSFDMFMIDGQLVISLSSGV